MRFVISKTFSLEINCTKRSGQISEELGHTDGVNSAGFVYIIVIPGVIVSKIKEFFTLFFALGKVSAKNFNRCSSGSFF